MARHLGRFSEAVADRFRILECISEGGPATVYLAEDLKHHRNVALKVLERDAPEAGELERFEREIETIARLRHPNILPLHDSGVVEGGLYFVMPHVEEGTLRDRIEREGPLPVDEALRIAREVAEALGRAHAAGVIHRDIKPANIMMESGHAVVSDFGIALLGAGQEDQRLTRSGASPGTPAYMSPEQAVGDEVVDHRTDIYSLGCVLYEMLTGDPPFSGSSGHAIVARKLVDPAPRISSVRDGVPDAVERITRKALARVPADRPQSAIELARVLGGLESSVRSAGADAWAQVGGTKSSGAGQLAAMAAIYAAGGTLLLLVIGLLTTRVFDLVVQVPPAYRPTRGDYLAVGAEAMVPFLLFGAVALGFGLLAGRYALPALVRWLPGGRKARVAGADDDAQSTWARVAGQRPGGPVADLFLVVMVTVSVLAFWPFRELYTSLVLSDSEIYGCSHSNFHRAHYALMPALVVGLGMARHTLFRWLRERSPDRRGWTMARWASGVWLVILIVVATLPWRVLWNSYYERARVDGEPAYVLAVDPEAVLAYTPSTGSARTFPVPETAVERLGVIGYLFEEPEAFTSPIEPRCAYTPVSSPSP